MKRLAWSEVRSARQPGLKQELRVLIELLRVLPRPGLPMHLTILPSNIMVGDDGSVLVGAVRLEGTSQQERYLAPEVQCGAEPMLPAAIYAVGALLFEAVTGHRFETRELVTQELAGARAMARAAGLGALFWEIYLLEAASKATEEQPEKRWTSGSEFAEDLERVARDRIVTRADLGRLVAELAENRVSSVPPARSSGPPEGNARAAPPPLPKKVRRRTSSSKQKATNATQSATNVAQPTTQVAQPATQVAQRATQVAQQAAHVAQKAANVAQKAARAAPIPRSDGDAPQLPLITALRVPNNLRLPETAPEAPAAAALGAAVPAPTPAAAPASAPAASPAPTPAASPAPAPAALPPSDPPSAASPLPSFDSGPLPSFDSSPPPGPSDTSTGSTPPPGRFNPVTLGPRIDPDPAIPQKPGSSVARVVVPSLSAPPPNPTEGGESRRRTLTGTGDLRWLEGLQPPADAMDPNRHGTLLGLGMPAPTARLEPAFPDVEPATIPLSRSPFAQSRSSTPPAGSPASSQSSQPPSNRSSSPSLNRSSSPSSNPPSGNRVRYVQPAPVDSSWDSVAGSESDARTSSSDAAFLPKKSWMGKVVLAVVVLVALGIGTLEVVGHYTDDDKRPETADSKPASDEPAERSDEPASEAATAQAARSRDESARAAEAEPAVKDPAPVPADEPEPSAEVTEASPAVAVEKPAAPAQRAAPVRRVPPPRAAPVRAAPPPPAAPAPPRAKGPDRDYGI